METRPTCAYFRGRAVAAAASCCILDLVDAETVPLSTPQVAQRVRAVERGEGEGGAAHPLDL